MIGFVPILAEAAQPQGIAALGINLSAILAQAFTFLLFFWVIKRFALGKIVATLEERRQTIDKGVLLGIEMEKEKTHLDEKVEELLQQARADADKIIADGKTEAAGVINKAEEIAQKQAKGIIEDAHSRIDSDIQKAKKELRQDMVQLVGRATEVIIDEKINPAKDAKLIERALQEVS